MKYYNRFEFFMTFHMNYSIVKRAILIVVIVLGALKMYPQISYESLVKSFDGFENGEFKKNTDQCDRRRNMLRKYRFTCI